MLFHASVSGSVSPTNNRNAGLAGITLELKNDDGDIVATTTTDRMGHYTFNELSTGNANVEVSPGLSSTGTYTVLVVPPTSTQAASAAATLMITRGDTNFAGIDFTLQRPKPTIPRAHAPVRLHCSVRCCRPPAQAVSRRC